MDIPLSVNKQASIDILALWGKSASGSIGGDPDFHPLVYHMLDVGNVASVILNTKDALPWLRRLSANFGANIEDLQQLIPFLIALHDIGKASPSFQAKQSYLWQYVQTKGFEPTPLSMPGFDHGIETFQEMKSYLRSGSLVTPTGRPVLFHLSIARALGAHHGRFLNAALMVGYPEVPTEHGQKPWRLPWIAARQILVEEMAAVFLLCSVPVGCKPGNLSALCMQLAGLAVLADWLGSNERFFGPSRNIPFRDYQLISTERAKNAINDLRLMDLLPATEEPGFSTLFPAIRSPGPIQMSLMPKSLPELPEQTLAIIEAPMGEGKTEAALYLASRLATGGARGLYFGLPTVATSNQMFGRVAKFMETWAGCGRAPGLLLINGRAELSGDFEDGFERMKLAEKEDPDGPYEVDDWFLPRKRSLLHPYGVGTVDQAMFGALNVRYVSLRLLGLAGKVIIVDEVHSYDLYMSTIVMRLLNWLRELGASVILLSATLPSTKRQELVQAFCGNHPDDEGEYLNAYPLITVADGGGLTKHPLILNPESRSPSRDVKIEWRNDGETNRLENATYLLDQVGDGGCAVWICNTVAEAQSCYRSLKELQVGLPEAERAELFLFHARFMATDRQRIEEAIVSRFGKAGNRPERSVLVATQVVEQSLDLDFDIMMSQLAPVDLVLQRMGRMHRHERGKRPPKVAIPRLLLLVGERDQNNVPSFLSYSRVYERFVLLKTLLALWGRHKIQVPGDIRWLVESVYDGCVPEELDMAKTEMPLFAFSDALKRFEVLAEQHRQKAVISLLSEPDKEGRFFEKPPLPAEDEALETDDWVAAQTRLGEPSARVVLLEEGEEDRKGFSLDADLRQMRHTQVKTIARWLIEKSASISNRPLVEHLRERQKKEPKGVEIGKFPGLRGYQLLWLQNREYQWSWQKRSYCLRLDDELGIQILNRWEVGI